MADWSPSTPNVPRVRWDNDIMKVTSDFYWVIASPSSSESRERIDVVASLVQIKSSRDEKIKESKTWYGKDLLEELKLL